MVDNKADKTQHQESLANYINEPIDKADKLVLTSTAGKEKPPIVRAGIATRKFFSEIINALQIITKEIM